MLAEVSSGRSERVSSWPTKLERRLGSAPPPPTSSIGAGPPPPPPSDAASNAVVRTVTTFFASEVRTVAIALPA